MRPSSIVQYVLAVLVLLMCAASMHAAMHAAEAPATGTVPVPPPLKAGIIGLDAHAMAWTKILNDPEAPGELGEMTVVVGYPGGSPDIPQSMELLERNVGPLRELGVEIVDSIDELLKKRSTNC